MHNSNFKMLLNYGKYSLSIQVYCRKITCFFYQISLIDNQTDDENFIELESNGLSIGL